MVTVRDSWLGRLRLPIIAAPMFLVSNLELTRACCKGRIVGGFPAGNARTPEQLDEWFDQLERDQAADPDAEILNIGLTLHGQGKAWISAELAVILERVRCSAQSWCRRG